MSLCNVRSLTILLVLELVVLESQVHGFTIMRPLEALGDHESADSSQWQTQSDPQKNVTSGNFTNETLLVAMPIETTAKTEDIKKNEVLSSMTLKITKPTKTLETLIDIQLPVNISASLPEANKIKTLVSNRTQTINNTSTNGHASTATTTETQLLESDTTQTIDNNLITSHMWTSTSLDTQSLGSNTTWNINDTSINAGSSTSITIKTTDESQDSTTNQPQQTTADELQVLTSSAKSTTNNMLTSAADQTQTSTFFETTTSLITGSEASLTTYYAQSEETYVKQNTSSEYMSTTSTGETTSVESSAYESDVSTSSTIASITFAPEENDKLSTTAETTRNETTINVTLSNYSKPINYETILMKAVNAYKKWETEGNNDPSYFTKTVNEMKTSSDTSSSTTSDGSSQSVMYMIKTESPSSSVTTGSYENTAPFKTATYPSTESTTEIETKSPVYEKTMETSIVSTETTGLPYWKKYTTIIRKRINGVPETEKDEVLVKAGSEQGKTTISLEKALSSAPDIQSLQSLKNDFLTSSKNDSTVALPSGSELYAMGESNSTETLLFAETTNILDITSALPKVVSSQRAGFLDYSTRTTTVGTKTLSVSTAKDNAIDLTTAIALNTTEDKNKDPNTENSKTDRPAMMSSMSSKSQMVEDAINEELMKEKMLSDSEEIAQRQKEDSFGSNIIQNTEPGTNVEDKLSVKPINNERRKSGTLYTVSPNYKPLKKIEVQQGKPFLRNPDDNSWRNESLSSLGIVFKANNSSKPFTQVLKNKSETSSLLENDSRGDQPELRERLEKIAEQRKSKKKKINQLGESLYTDYEESASGENNSTTRASALIDNHTSTRELIDYTTEANRGILPQARQKFKFELFTEMSTGKSKQHSEDYEDDDEVEFTLPNIDIKKYMTPPSTDVRSSQPPPQSAVPADRRPTVQYFPPRNRPGSARPAPTDYDTDFQRKINEYTYSTSLEVKQTPPVHVELTPSPRPRSPAAISSPPPSSRTPASPAYATHDAGSNRGSFVIKHLRDFIEDVIKADESPVAPGTEVPLRGITTDEFTRAGSTRVKPPRDYYDYEAQFQRTVLSKFVDNFNDNSERFKSEFPILYNTTVVHAGAGAGAGEGGTSHALLRRLHGSARARPCERTVELSPAYELHYYVPEEEEKQELQPKPPAPHHSPYRLRL